MPRRRVPVWEKAGLLATPEWPFFSPSNRLRVGVICGGKMPSPD